MTRPPVTIIGAGCAGLSLAAALPQYTTRPVIVHGQPSLAEKQPHIWGFWEMDWLSDAAMLSRTSWPVWEFSAPGHPVIRHMTDTNPYHALVSSDWLSACRKKAQTTTFDNNNVAEQLLAPDKATDTVFDSRPPYLDEPFMKQHFLGWEVYSKTPIFEAGIARLMDFNTDQSRGIHFIYLLPFDAHTALVESTMFSLTTEPDSWYEDAIKAYLFTQFSLTDFTVERTEKGCIPMAFPARTHSSYPAIGSNSGAVRPSSGYAFTFIQKQVAALARQFSGTPNVSDIHVPRPHRRRDLLMDAVFLDVLKHAPAQAPDLFITLAQALRGDELARFMSGIAGPAIIGKIIYAMPKWLFLRSAFRVCLYALIVRLKGAVS